MHVNYHINIIPLNFNDIVKWVYEMYRLENYCALTHFLKINAVIFKPTPKGAVFYLVPDYGMPFHKSLP